MAAVDTCYKKQILVELMARFPKPKKDIGQRLLQNHSSLKVSVEQLNAIMNNIQDRCLHIYELTSARSRSDSSQVSPLTSCKRYFKNNEK